MLRLRPSLSSDLPAITAIYGHAVRHGTGTFELDAPDVDDMARRRDDVLAKGLPWLVAERDGQVLGYAYANHFRPRRAYRFCLEDSIYLRPGGGRPGCGQAAAGRTGGAMRGAGRAPDAGRDRRRGQRGLDWRPCALGFRHTGVLSATGWKFGRWLDVVLMQRSLGWGDGAPAAD